MGELSLLSKARPNIRLADVLVDWGVVVYASPNSHADGFTYSRRLEERVGAAALAKAEGV